MQTKTMPKSHDTTDNKLIKTSTSLPPEMWKRLVNHAREKGVSKSELIFRLIEKELECA